jgi:hypothetical protein
MPLPVNTGGSGGTASRTSPAHRSVRVIVRPKRALGLAAEYAAGTGESLALVTIPAEPFAKKGERGGGWV